MNIGKRALSMAIALIVASSPAGVGLAMPSTDEYAKRCTAAGGVWDDTLGCADKQCHHNGKAYKHGAEVATGRYPQLRTVWRCNGYTGQWSQVRMAGDESPHMPPIVTNAG